MSNIAPDKGVVKKVERKRKQRRTIDKATWDKCEKYIAEKPYEPGLPTAADLALYLGVSRRTIFYWQRKNRRFRDYFDFVKTAQEQMLWNKALSKRWHSGMAQFALVNFGYAKINPKDQLDRDKLVQEINLKIEEVKKIDAKQSIRSGDG